MKEVSFELGGKQRPLVFDLGTLRLVGQFNKREPMEGTEGLEAYTQVISAVYCGMQREHKTRKAEFPFSVEDVQEWVDCLSSQEALVIIRAFNEAYRLEGEEQAPADAEADKKK